MINGKLVLWEVYLKNLSSQIYHHRDNRSSIPIPQSFNAQLKKSARHLTANSHRVLVLTHQFFRAIVSETFTNIIIKTINQTVILTDPEVKLKP